MELGKRGQDGHLARSMVRRRVQGLGRLGRRDCFSELAITQVERRKKSVRLSFNDPVATARKKLKDLTHHRWLSQNGCHPKHRRCIDREIDDIVAVLQDGLIGIHRLTFVP